MSRENKTIVRQTIEDVWNRRNLDVVDERFASDYIGHTFAEIHGPDGVKERFVSPLSRAFPNLRFTIDDEIAEGDRVVQRWTARGTHDGEFQGILPTGKDVTITGISLFRVANSKIVEGWTNADMMGLMQQLGASPIPEQS